jgi:hypothetical protein
VSTAVPIVGLFAMSSLFALESKIHYAKNFAKAGFVAIILFMSFIATVNVANIINPDIWKSNPIAEKIASQSNNSKIEDVKNNTTFQNRK